MQGFDKTEARELQLLVIKAFTVFSEAIHNLAALCGISQEEARKQVENLLGIYSQPVEDPDPENKIFDEDEAETH